MKTTTETTETIKITVPEPAWTPSTREEVISALWFIAGFTAQGAEIAQWICNLLFFKATLNLACAWRHAIIEYKADKAEAAEQDKTPAP